MKSMEYRKYFLCFSNKTGLKQVLSIILSFALLLPFLTKGWIWIDFKMNQDYIAKVLCENKDIPQTTCNGKCYLKKQLKKEEKKEPTPLPTTKREVVEIIGIETYPSIHITIQLNQHLTSSYDENLYSFMFMDVVWHPPKCV